MLNKEVYSAFGTQELIQKSSSEMLEVIMNFLEKEFDAESVLNEYIEEQLI